MENKKIVKVLILISLFVVFALSGCRNFIVPDQGAVALENARIALPAEGLRDAVWKEKDMEIRYSIVPTGEGMNISGTETLDDSIVMSFPAVDHLQVKISFLDEQGRVLMTADITPRYSARHMVDKPLDFKTLVVLPPGTSSFAFSYWGSFFSVPREVAESWDINYFPFQ